MLSSELSLYLDAIEKVAGTRWLHDQVERIRDTDPRHMIGAKPCDTGIHPLALAWFKAREELILSEITGNTSFSEGALRVAQLGKDLLSTSGLAGLTAQKSRLLAQNLFREAAFEITIAGGYVRAGRRVEFTAPGLMVGSPGSRVIVVCFTEIRGTGNAGPGLCEIIGKELNEGEGYTCPAIAYFELDGERCNSLHEHISQNIEKLKTLLAGKAYSALVLTCRGRAAGPGGTALHDESTVFINPAPRFPLPGGFKIYSPGETSSIS